MSLHARFSVNPEPFARWLLDRELPPPGARVLDAGCGPASLWAANLDRIDPSWRLTLVDASPGMIEAARAVLGDRADYAVASVEELPFADRSFDVVVANHMLYHVDDRPRALRELARVLEPGGVLHVSTNGDDHLRQLHELVGSEWSAGFVEHMRDFGLETGRAQLEAVFADVRCERYANHLEVTDVEALLAYVRSSMRWRGDDGELRARLLAATNADGILRVETDAGVFHARKP